MREIDGMKRGVKLEAQPTNSQRIREIDVELKNSLMAQRVCQMMVQQLMTNLQNMGQDLGKAYGIISELQYKLLAVQSVANLDVKALNDKAAQLRLNDFIEASDAEDVKSGFTLADKVQEESTVIITSTTQGADAGLFRSRIKLAECGNPGLIAGLTGAPIGAKVKTVLNGVEHEVELLGIRNPPVVASEPAVQSN